VLFSTITGNAEGPPSLGGGKDPRNVDNKVRKRSKKENKNTERG
jgi:hypothetical protein